jgi:hypothetical protein
MLEAANQIIEKLKVGSFVGKVLLSETDAETINPIGYLIVNITQAGAAETRTLGNGEEGQILILINTAYAADTVVTPVGLVGTTITFNADEDVWVGVFLSGEWHTLFVYGSTAVA